MQFPPSRLKTGATARFWLVGFGVSILIPLFGCANHTSGKGPHDVYFAYGQGDGVYILNGDGSLKKKVLEGAYYQPALSPDKTKMACVYDENFQVRVFNLDTNFEFQDKPKNIVNSDAVSQDSKYTPASCPLWSPDGQKLYFLTNNHLVVYDYQLSHTTSIFDFTSGQAAGQTDATGNMKWSKGGDSLYCMLQAGGGKLAFWSVSASGGQGSEVAELDQQVLTDFNFPSTLPGDFVESLFGSKENPVLGPLFSTDGRYYFSIRKDKGFLSSSWIEGYDRNTKDKFDVTTIGTSLYAN